MRIRFHLALMGSLFLLAAGGLLACSAHRPRLASSPAWEPYAALSVEERVADARQRRRDYYARRLKTFIEEADACQPGGTVFLGDSITEQFPLAQAFAGRNVINRGISGDRIGGLRERLDVCVTQLAPSRIYVMIGTNDIFARTYSTTEALAGDYRALLREIRFCAPRAKVTVFSVLPTGLDFTGKNPRIAEYNKVLEPLARAEGFKYFDLHPFLADESGALQKSYTREGIHLTLDGYYAWLEAFLSPEDFFQVAVNLATRWREEHATPRPAAKVDPRPPFDFPGGRGANELIVYTPAYGQRSTGTNKWGIEAVVTRGVVTRLSQFDSPIPAAGMVLSAHGKAADWITANLAPGARLMLDGKSIVVLEPDFDSLTNEQAKVFLKRKLYTALDAVSQGKASPRETKQMRRLLFALQRLDPTSPEARARLCELRREVERL